MRPGALTGFWDPRAGQQPLAYTGLPHSTMASSLLSGDAEV